MNTLERVIHKMIICGMKKKNENRMSIRLSLGLSPFLREKKTDQRETWKPFCNKKDQSCASSKEKV